MKHSAQDPGSVITKQQRSLAQLLTILQRLSLIIPSLTPRDYKQLLSDRSRLLELVSRGKKVLHKSCGFTLAVAPSCIKGGGRGVFVESGHVEKDQLVALYPGMTMPVLPLLGQFLPHRHCLPSIRAPPDSIAREFIYSTMYRRHTH